MFKILDEKERDNFVRKYFNAWAGDIWKVSSIEYNGVVEYLINEHYLFRTINN